MVENCRPFLFLANERILHSCGLIWLLPDFFDRVMYIIFLFLKYCFKIIIIVWPTVLLNIIDFLIIIYLIIMDFYKFNQYLSRPYIVLYNFTDFNPKKIMMMKIALQYDQSPPCDLKAVFKVVKEKQKMLVSILKLLEGSRQMEALKLNLLYL